MKVEAINKLIEKSKKSVARYDGKSVLEMKQRILVELEDLRYFIIKEVNNEDS
jgi:hypothetical protein